MGQTFDTVVRERVKQLADLRRRMDKGEKIQLQVPTGLTDLDKNGGLEIGVLTAVGGSSGDGKSVVALHLARAAALAGNKVVVLSMEDPKEKTADRAVAGITGIPAFELGRAEFQEADIRRLLAAVEDIDKWGHNVILESGLLNSRQVTEAQRDNPEATLTILDYLQALPDEPGKTRERTISDLCWDLNKAAQDNAQAVVAFSQLKPDVEGRGQARFQAKGVIDGYRPGPGRSDLSWASAIGERAKSVWYLFRPGRWARKHGLDSQDNKLEIIVEKASFGREGTVTVGWDGAGARVYDLQRKPK